MRRIERAGWLLAVVVLVALVAPSVARSVAPQLVAVVGQTNNKPVTVTPANQLLAGEFNPTQVVNIHSPSLGPNSICKSMYTVPAGKALVIDTASFTMIQSGAAMDAKLYAGATPCDAPTMVAYQAQMGVGATGIEETFQQDFKPGIIVKAGLTVSYGQSLRGDPAAIGDIAVFLHGYLIPAAAAPPTPVQNS